MNILARIRREKRITQIDLAKAAQIDRATISLIENGRMRSTRNTLAMLEAALDVPQGTLSELEDTGRSDRAKEARKKDVPLLNLEAHRGTLNDNEAGNSRLVAVS